MHLTSFLLRRRCPGSCFAGDFPDTCWGFVVRESCFLCSFLCNSPRLVPCFNLCSWGPGCCSSIEGRLTNCIAGCSGFEGEGYSIGGVAVEGRRLRSFDFLRTRFRAVLSSEH